MDRRTPAYNNSKVPYPTRECGMNYRAVGTDSELTNGAPRDNMRQRFPIAKNENMRPQHFLEYEDENNCMRNIKTPKQRNVEASYTSLKLRSEIVEAKSFPLAIASPTNTVNMKQHQFQIKKTQHYPLTEVDNRYSNARMPLNDTNNRFGDERMMVVARFRRNGEMNDTEATYYDTRSSEHTPFCGKSEQQGLLREQRVDDPEEDGKGEKAETIVDYFNGKLLEASRGRHLVGTVDRVVYWYRMIVNSTVSLPLITFTVLGHVDRVMKGRNKFEVILLLKGDRCILQCSFYEIDRQCPGLFVGSGIACVGNMIGTNKLRTFDIQTDPKLADLVGIERSIFLSQRTLQDILAEQPLQENEL